MRLEKIRPSRRAAAALKPVSIVRRRWLGFASTLLLLCVVSAQAVQTLQTPAGGGGAQGRGSRSAGVQPKRPTTRRDPARAEAREGNTSKAQGPSRTLEASAAPNSLGRVLAMADFDVIGLAATAGPATQTVPKNTPTAVLASVQVPEGGDPAAIIAGLNPKFRVRGELMGPSLASPLVVEARLGEPLNIPPLSRAGDHVLQNLRVVDTGLEGEAVVAPVTPDSCGIVVIDRLLISEVRVNELTYEQIVQAGINITDDSYRAFNFTLGVGTTSDAQPISIPVAFPSVGASDPRPVVGVPSLGVGSGVPIPDVIPIMLEIPEGEGAGQDLDLEGEGPIRIPGVIVFPGRVGLLHQFFEAIVIVANGAPNGTPLVVRGLRAKAKLPDNGTPDPSDDPLRIAETQAGGRISDLEIHGLGADSRYGTGDDTDRFTPGQSGQATFLLEGMKEGLHTVNFELEGTLEGLPRGPVTVRGEVPGAVLVRDASFAVTFTHPSVVRAGQEYDLAMTMYNSGQRDILGAFASLSRNSISGASFAAANDTGRRAFQTTVKRGESATVKWRLRASTTGAVTASYVKVGGDVSAGLTLVTGVGDRNVPLSPESLVLPDPVAKLPSDVVEAARAVLGQAWSVANAPAGSLPQGVRPVSKQAVIDRAVELGVAGMRVDFGEPVSVSLETLVRDWLGELKPDDGFADVLRDTPSGYVFFDTVGTYFARRLGSGEAGTTPAELHRELANAESPRSPFVSALVTQASGAGVFGARLVGPQGSRVGFGENAAERAGELAQGASLNLALTDAGGNVTGTAGQLLLASNPGAGDWQLELFGRQAGAGDVSLLVPAGGRSYRQVVFGGVQFAPGAKYRVKVRPGSPTTPVLEEFRDGAYHATAAAPSVETLSEPAPRLVGAIQVTPDVVGGGDRYGRLLGLLFSKPMAREQAETAANYRVGGGALKGSNPPQQVGGQINVRSARLDLGSRFVFISLDAPFGPYIDRDIDVSNLRDARGATLTPAAAPQRIEPRVSPQGNPPGAYLTGRVMSADGTPVTGAQVVYWTQPCDDGKSLFGGDDPIPVALRQTGADGLYAFDYVRNGDCGPLFVTVTNPVTRSTKRLTTPVVYDGQHMTLDLVFLARGKVSGSITSGGRAVPNAFVRIVPELDVVGSKVVQADAQGNYAADDIPVGNVSVAAVGTGAFSNATGLAAGTITGPGRTAVVNVSMQNVSGAVSGRVVNPDQSPVPGALVVAYAPIAGFQSDRADGYTAVGYVYAARDGGFRLENLPVGDIKIEVTDYVTGLKVGQAVQLSNGRPELDGLLIAVPGYGSVTGTVTDDTGTFVPDVIVGGGGITVRADALGQYTLPNLRPGTQTITAFDPVSRMTGSTVVPVRLGETTSGANITVTRPATVTGRVTRLNGATETPVSGVIVTNDGTNAATTDAQGRYTLKNLPPNTEFILRVVDPATRLASNLPMVLGPGANVTRDVKFRTASLHGRVTQPDGVTGVVAQVDVYVPLPKLSKGPDFGLLSSDKPVSVSSGGDGSYQLTGLNPGPYRATVSNGFFPTRVSKGGTLVAGEDAECNLTLVNRLAGKIQGRVFQPDGTTPVGAGVEVTLGGGSLADVTVRTDEAGHYEFAEVFSEGGYALTASDTETGLKNRAYISVRFNQDTVADIRLRGLGALRVRVVDGGGNPVPGGQISLDGSDFPNARRFTSVTPDLAGVVLYDGLPEGNYAVAASHNGLGGRASATVTPGSTVEITVKLQASGAVEGRVSMPGGTTHVGLADVQLFAGGRAIGFTTTDDTDAARGSFSFVGVPAGDFTVDVLDNRTGRVGRGHGRITQQGETASVNVELLPVGRVAGRVTANGQPVDHALVEISADASGLRYTRLQATTDPDGRYSFTGIPVGRFNLHVTNVPGGQTGAASGTVSGNTEPLPDTVVDIMLEPSATVTGTVYRAGGTEPLPGARVTLFAGSRRLETATNAAGVYRVSFVPLGELKVRAEAPVGFDRGEAAMVSLDAPGSTATVNVALAGVGSVAGDALDSNGTRLAAGTVTFVNDAWGSPLVLVAPVQPNGRYEITGAPAGAFTLKLTVSNRVGIGTASGAVVAGQSLELPVQIEDAGSATGTIVAPDGVTPVRGADITLTLARAGKPSLRFFTNTNAAGVWSLENLPLGAVSVAVSDVVSGGVARATNLPLSTNGQRLDVGRMVLDNTPIRVESVTPADAATGVSPTSPRSVNVTFSEPADPATVHAGSVRLLNGAAGVGANVTLSADGRTATLTASNRLADSTAYTVLVTGVADPTGHALANEFRSTFITSDETGPSVVGVAPAAEAAEVALDAAVVVTFNEPVDRAQDFDGLVRLLSGPAPGEAAAGAVMLDESGKVATFRPAGALSLSRRYTVSVAGVRDLAGNVQPAAFTSRFVSVNPAPSVSLDEPAEGAQWTEGQTVRLAATASDNTAVARVLFKVNGVTVGASSAAPYAVNYTPPVGQVGSVNVEAVAEDDLAKTTSAARAVTVVADPVPTVTLTSPAEGTQLVEGQTIELAATAADNGSVARVVFTANGSALGTDTSEPYAQTFTVPAGVSSVTLGAQAFDNLGKHATASRSFAVIPDPGTIVRGRVVNNSGQPVPNASVSVFDAYTATTGADGRFQIAGVPTVRGDIAARATATINARSVTTVSEARAPEPRATTELGDITLAVMQFESDLGALANFGGSNDDSYVPVDLPFAFKFYGQSYTQVFLGTNGYLTFGGGDSTYSAHVGSFNAQLPRVAALFDDWLPQQVPTNGVYVNTQLPGRAVFTWRVVPQYGTGLTATFQAVLFANGRIQLGYNAVQTRGGLVGVTPGSAPNVQDVDFSAQSFSVDSATAPYEHFGGAGHLFDLERTYIGFTPTVSGGYDVQVQPPSAGGDNAGPVVTTVSPAADAAQVATDAPVTVTFNEPLDRTQDPRNVLKVYASAQPSTALAGDVTLDDSGQVLTFRPAGGFAESTRYTATVTGQMDAIGNIQFGIVNASFTTVDRTPPQITSFLIAGQPAADGMVVNSTKRPPIAVAYQDTSSIDTAATRLLFGPSGSTPTPVAASVGAGGLTYQPAADLAAGVYVAQAVVADRWGNTTTTDAVRFTVNTELPSITGVTPSEGTRYGQTEVVIRGLHLNNVAPAGGAASPGLRGDYFVDSYPWDEGTYFNRLLFTREDATVDFDWGSGPPAPDAPEDLFMVRWTGQVEPRFSETYNFHAVTDDGVRLWVNGEQVIDHWVAQAPTESTGTITLEAGRKYDIRMEYYEQYGGAVARLLWSSPSQPKEVIPAERLTHPALSLPEVYVGGTRAVVTGGSFGSTDQLLIRTPGGPIGPADVEVRTDHGNAVLRGGFNYLATPPQVVSFEPADNATQVSPATKVSVTFDQPLDPEQDMTALVRVSEYTCSYYCYSYPVVGTVTFDPAGTTLTFTPVGRLNDSRSYFVEVGNVRSRDGMYGGNRSSYFTTADGTAPVISPWTYNGQTVDGQTLPFSRPQLYVNITEPGSGANAASLVVTLDGQAVTSGVSFYGYALYFTPDEPLSNGAHTVTARVADNAGNVSQVSAATFTVSDVVQVASLAPASGSEQGGTVIKLRGSGLINSDGGQPAVLVGGHPATDDLDDEDCSYWRTAGACLAVRVPAGTPGPADVVVQTDHGVATVAGGFTYLVDPRSRFEVEPDTALLWHFEWNDSYWDDDDNFPVPGYYTWDFGPYSLDASDNWDSPSGFVTQGYPSRGVVGEGRFGDGVKDPALTAVEDYGVLGFGERGFTIEGWIKTDAARPLSRTHTVFGKENAQGQQTDYALSLLPSGVLRAQVFNAQGVAWEAATEASAGVADGAWHSLALVVERGAAAAENRLVIYVNGVERASSVAPTGFGAVRDGGERFRAGHSDADGEGYEKATFPGWMDEVRVSSTAHTAERILHTYQGTTRGLVALTATPGNVERDGVERNVEIAGYNLRGVTATVTAADGSALPVAVSVTSTSATRASLVITADPAAPLGEARLNFSANGRTATLPFAITSQHASEAEPGTVLLWHLDETSGYELVDSGPNGITGRAVNYAWPESGLFGNARGRRVSLAADADHAALAFGASGFTVQTWVRGNLRYEMGAFTLVGKQDEQGQNSDFELTMLPTGELRAQVYDTHGTVWEVKGPASAADWNWHLVSMVVERGAAAAENRLVIYVDGVERASSVAPAGFGAVRNTGNVIRAGNRDFDGPEDNTEWGPGDAFYGYLDDIHVLNYAQPAARVRGYWLGLTLAELGQASRGGAQAMTAQAAALRLQSPSAANVSTDAARALTPATPSVKALPAARTSATPKSVQARRPPEARSAREGALRRADGGGFLKKRTPRAARG